MRILLAVALLSGLVAFAQSLSSSKTLAKVAIGCDTSRNLDQEGLLKALEDKDLSAEVGQVLCHLLSVEDKQNTKIARHLPEAMSVADAIALNTFNSSDCNVDEFLRRKRLSTQGCPSMTRYLRFTSWAAGVYCKEHFANVVAEIESLV